MANREAGPLEIHRKPMERPPPHSRKIGDKFPRMPFPCPVMTKGEGDLVDAVGRWIECVVPQSG